MTNRLRFFALAAVLGGGVTRLPAAPPQIDAQDTKVTAQLARVLRERIVSPSGLKLEVKPTAKADQGHFADIRIQGRPAQLRKLRVSEFTLHATDVHLDVPYLFSERKVRTLSSKTSLRAVISEDDLTAMLASGRHTKEMGLKVKYMGDRLSVTGNLNFPLINGPVTGVGKLRLMPGHKVYLDILSLKLRGVETPQFVKDQFSSRINPVVDYQDLPFNPPFKGVKVEGNKATIYT